MANPSRGIISPAFVKCWTASPVISCVIIRKPPRALASKKAAGSFKTEPCTFRSRSPLSRILPKQTFSINCPAVVQFAAGLCHTRFTCICGRQLPSLRPFRGRLPKPCPLCQDAATGQSGCRQEKAGPPGPVFFIETFTLHHTPYKSPPAYSPTRFLTAWTESAPVGFCMFFPRILSSKIGVRRNCN